MDNDIDFVYPDCYLNTAITQRKLTKIVSALNGEILERVDNHFRRKTYVWNGEELGARDRSTVTSALEMREYLFSSNKFGYVRRYDPSMLPSLLSLIGDAKPNFYVNPDVEFVVNEIYNTTMRLYKINDFTGINEYDSILNNYATIADLWYVLNVNQAQLLNGGRLFQSVVGLPFKDDTNYVSLLIDDKEVIFNSRVMIILTQKAGRIVLSRELVTMLSDLSHQRLFVYKACALGVRLSPLTYPELGVLMAFVKWGDDVLIECGNEGYNIIKCVEPIVTMCLLELEPDCTDINLFNEGIIGSQTDTARRHLLKLYKLLKGVTSPHHLSQLFGLFRSWGHPLVNVREGLWKIRQLGQKPKEVDTDKVSNVNLTFRYEFVKNFHSVKGFWPKLTSFSTAISRLQKYNIRPNLNVNCTLDDFKLIKFEKTFDVSPSANLSSLMSDKSISVELSQLVHEIRENKSIGKSVDRRVILEMLRKDYSGVKELLDRIDKEGFYKWELLIGLLEKERELKIEPRLFAMLTFVMRIYFVATEDLIANNILPYFPEITKTYDYLDLKKKFCEIVGPMTDSCKGNVVRLVLNIDFEKWNTNERDVLVNGIFSDIDNLHGYSKVVSRTHECFEKSLLYSASVDANLEVEGDSVKENDWAWIGHLGGLEGLRQGGWTVHTVCALIDFCDKRGLKFQILGQGDNQVLILDLFVPYENRKNGKIETLNYVRDRVKGIKTELNVFMKDLGLPIKKEETWESANLFAYGKNLFFKGEPLSMDLKQISRMYPLLNTSFPSTEIKLGNIFSTGVGASSLNVIPNVSYLMSLWCGGTELIRMENFNPMLDMSMRDVLRKMAPSGQSIRVGKNTSLRIQKEELLSAYKSKRLRLIVNLLLPRAFGGFSVQNFPAFYIRGFPDSPSLSLSYLKELWSVSTGQMREGVERCLDIELSNEVNPILLFENVDSLNPLTPSVGEAALRAISEEVLTKTVEIRNTWFNSVVSWGVNEHQTLAESLFNLEPMHVLMFSDLLDSSVPGYSKKVLGQVTKASTVRSLAQAEGGIPVMQKLREGEFNMTLHMYRKAGKIVDYDKVMSLLSNPTVNKLEHMREEGWGKRIDGVTVPHPIALLHPIENGVTCNHCETIDSDVPERDFFVVTVSDRVAGYYDPLINKYEDTKPYLGSKTREKVQAWQKKVSTVAHTPLLTSSLNLLRVIGWGIESGSPADLLVRRCVESVTDIDLSFATNEDSQTKGEIDHRYRSSRSERQGIYGCLTGPLRHLIASSNCVTSYARGMENVLLHFQAAFIHCLMSTVLRSVVGRERVGGTYHFHFRTKDELPIMKENSLVGDESWAEVTFPRGKPPYTFFTEDSNIIRLHRRSFELTRIKDTNKYNIYESICCWYSLRLAQSIYNKTEDLNEKVSTRPLPMTITMATRIQLSDILKWTLLWLVTFKLRRRISKISPKNSFSAAAWLPKIVEAMDPLVMRPLLSYLSTIDLCVGLREEYNMVVSDYPYSERGCCNLLKACLLKEVSCFEVKKFMIERCTKICLIVNDPSKWDFELRYLVTLTACKEILTVRRKRSNMVPLLMNWTYYQDQRELIVDMVKQFKVALDDAQQYTECLFGSLENISELVKRKKKSYHISPRAVKYKEGSFSGPICNLENQRSSIADPYYKAKIEKTVRELIERMKRSISWFDNNMYKEPRGSTAGFLKISEVVRTDDVIRNSFVVVVGDGTGGTSSYFKTLSRSDLTVVGITYKSLESQPFETVEIPIPPSQLMMGYYNMSPNENGNNFIGDILSPGFLDQFRKIPRERLVFISDIEGAVWGTNGGEIMKTYARISTEVRPYILILKIYLSNEGSFDLIDMLSRCYDSVTIKKPIYSSLDNSEVFMVLKNPTESESSGSIWGEENYSRLESFFDDWRDNSGKLVVFGKEDFFRRLTLSGYRTALEYACNLLSTLEWNEIINRPVECLYYHLSCLENEKGDWRESIRKAFYGLIMLCVSTKESLDMKLVRLMDIVQNIKLSVNKKEKRTRLKRKAGIPCPQPGKDYNMTLFLRGIFALMLYDLPERKVIVQEKDDSPVVMKNAMFFINVNPK